MSTTGWARRDLFKVAGLAGAGLALGGCGGSGQPQVATGPPLSDQGYTGKRVTISFWNGFTGGDGPPMRKLIDEFNAGQDMITVKQNTVQWLQYYQRVVAAVHAGQSPDVGAMHLEQLGTQAARQSVNPLDDVVKEMGLKAEEYPEEVWEKGVVQGQRYGIPLDVHSLASYANNALLEKSGLEGQPGQQGFEQALQTLEGSGVEQPFWMPNRWPAHLIFLSLLWQNGGEPYAEDGSKALFDSEAGVKALSYMRKQVEAGVSPANVAVDTQYTAFKNGSGAFTWDGIWQINDLKTNAPQLDWSIAPVPTVGEQPAVWANSHHLVLFRQRNPDEDRLQASKVFIKYLTEQSAAWSAAGMIPARSSAREAKEFTESPQAALAAAIPDMRFLPALPAVGDVQAQTLEIAVSDAVLGRQEPAAALKSAAAQATSLMQGNLRKFAV